MISAVKQSAPSVHRFSYIFHHPVELFWLISINVVRGIVYHLRRGQTEDIKTSKLQYNTNKYKLSDTGVELGARP